MFGICHLSVIPCRKEPSDRSEMVTQLLFGEHFEVLEEKKSWTLIKTSYDDYECWIDKKQFISVESDRGLKLATTAVTTDLLQLAETENEEMIPLVLGSSLPNFKNNRFSIGRSAYTFKGDAEFPFARKNGSTPDSIAEAARWYLNAPYLWGGRSPFGIDCSGFTQMVYKLNGWAIKRDAWQQAKQGSTISFLEESITGDLAFFDNEEGKIIHVGIVLAGPSKGKNAGFRIIHASGKVRIDTLDHQGIFNADQKKYSHRLRVIRRLTA